MTKVIINNGYGGFGLSEAGLLRYAEIKGITIWLEDSMMGMKTAFTVPPEERISTDNWHTFPSKERAAIYQKYKEQRLYAGDLARDDPILVQVVEELGAKANSRFASLEIVEIPDDVKWHIEEYDGIEWIAEDHRTWPDQERDG